MVFFDYFILGIVFKINMNFLVIIKNLYYFFLVTFPDPTTNNNSCQICFVFLYFKIYELQLKLKFLQLCVPKKHTTNNTFYILM